MASSSPTTPADTRTREDVAESVLPYFALRYRPNRLSSGQRAAIADTIPNRIAYFDGAGARLVTVHQDLGKSP